MGLAAKLGNGGALRTKIHVSEIRRNELNRLHIDDEKVKAIAWSIQQRGQLENATVYEDKRNDGKKYTLIGGETRWRAISYLYEKGAMDGSIFVTIIPKPKDFLEEKILIRDDNLQRNKSDEDLYIDILDAEDEYEYLSQIGKRPTGKKRDYVGMCIGKSGRHVDNIKKKFEGIDDDGKPVVVDQISTESESNKDGKNKKEKDAQLEDLRVCLEKMYQCQIKVTKKSIQFKCADTEALNDLLEELGIQERLDLNNV